LIEIDGDGRSVNSRHFPRFRTPSTNSSRVISAHFRRGRVTVRTFPAPEVLRATWSHLFRAGRADAGHDKRTPSYGSLSAAPEFSRIPTTHPGGLPSPLRPAVYVPRAGPTMGVERGSSSAQGKGGDDPRVVGRPPWEVLLERGVTDQVCFTGTHPGPP